MRNSILATLLLAMAAPLAAQALAPDEVLTSIVIQPVAPPHPVLGADGRIHLAYELLATNTTSLFVTLDRVDVVDPAGTTAASLSGPALAAMTTTYSGDGLRIDPGGAAMILLDATYPGGAALPATLAARVTATRAVMGKDGKPGPFPKTAPVPATIVFTTAATPIGKPAVVVAPPLRGPRWVAFNGCCDTKTAHRGAEMAVNGTLYIAQRFAIDWVQLDAKDRLFAGDVSKLASYTYYGTPVHAVADGTVVRTYTDSVNQVAGAAAKGITPATIGGNMIVVDIGGGNFAFFAHLQPGSLKVKVGDTVRAGDVIALLGNSGNTDGPHLHFHVMDGPSPLASNGLPYAFTRFTGQGVVLDASTEAAFTKGAPAVIDRAKWAGPHVNQLPLNEQVVDFGE